MSLFGRSPNGQFRPTPVVPPVVKAMPPPKSGAEISNSIAMNLFARAIGMEAEALRQSLNEATQLLSSPEVRDAFVKTASLVGSLEGRLERIESKLDRLLGDGLADDRGGLAVVDRAAADAGSDCVANLDPRRIAGPHVVSDRGA